MTEETTAELIARQDKELANMAAMWDTLFERFQQVQQLSEKRRVMLEDLQWDMPMSGLQFCILCKQDYNGRNTDCAPDCELAELIKE